jgi:threonine/homoserine/homoserine lactone efflux protein
VIEPGVAALFALACLPIVLAPGPSVAFVMTTALSSGRRTGLSAVGGVESGYIVHVLAAALGLSAVLAVSAEAFTVVKLLGAAYLVWLGVRAWMSKDVRPIGEIGRAQAPAITPRQAYGRGFTVGVLNPKTAIFFLSFLPQFVRADAGPVPLQLTVLGLIFVVMASIPDVAWALSATGIRRLLPRVKMRSLERVSGTVMFGLAGYALTASHK